MVPTEEQTMARPAASAPAVQVDVTLVRILGAIEEYVYTGEFLPDDSYRVIFAGPCRERFLGMGVEDARTAVWADYVHPDDVEIFDDAHSAAHVTGHLDVEYRLVGADGVLRWVRDRGRLRRENGLRLLDGSILDVTAMHAARAELEAAHAYADHLARTDALTGVSNRRSLPELTAATEGAPLGVLSLDVDRFKLINDFYGHAAGDAVLVELAERLRATRRPGDHIVRMGGEEFLMLLPRLADETALRDYAERVRSSVGGAPFTVGLHHLEVSVSIGATWAAAGRDFEVLLAAADHFLYAAKRAGRNRVHVASPEQTDVEREEDEGDSLRIAHAMATAAAAAEGMPDGHLIAVSQLAVRIARGLGASPHQVLRCRLAGLLHDLGKLQIPAAILNKPEALDGEEQALVLRHPEHGERLVAAVPELAPVAGIVRHHRERYDGTGYPDGLAGDAIPFEARIIAAADTWHTLTTDRPYRGGIPASRARAELTRVAGHQLDPAVVAELLAAVS